MVTKIPTALIYIALLLVWITTPLMGDRAPLWAQWVYWCGLVTVSSLAGMVVAVRGKNLLLGAASALTLFAWPLILIIALAFA